MLFHIEALRANLVSHRRVVVALVSLLQSMDVEVGEWLESLKVVNENISVCERLLKAGVRELPVPEGGG